MSRQDSAARHRPKYDERRQYQRFETFGAAHLLLTDGSSEQEMVLLDASPGGFLALGAPPFSHGKQGRLMARFSWAPPQRLSVRVTRTTELSNSQCWAGQLTQPNEDFLARAVLSSLLDGGAEPEAARILLCTTGWTRYEKLFKALLQSSHELMLARTPMSAIGWLVDERLKFRYVLLDADAANFASSLFLPFLRSRFPAQRPVLLTSAHDSEQLNGLVGAASGADVSSGDWAVCAMCGGSESLSYRAGVPRCLECYDTGAKGRARAKALGRRRVPHSHN